MKATVESHSGEAWSEMGGRTFVSELVDTQSMDCRSAEKGRRVSSPDNNKRNNKRNELVFSFEECGMGWTTSAPR